MSYEIWDLEAGQPPQLKELVGLRVGKAWIIRTELMVWLKPNFILRVRRGPTIGLGVLLVETGTMIATMPWSQIDRFEDHRSPEMDALTGLKFEGLDGHIVDFGNYGVAMLPGGAINFMKAGKEGRL
jgi:hypothetical protein